MGIRKKQSVNTCFSADKSLANNCNARRPNESGEIKLKTIVK